MAVAAGTTDGNEPAAPHSARDPPCQRQAGCPADEVGPRGRGTGRAFRPCHGDRAAASHGDAGGGSGPSAAHGRRFGDGRAFEHAARVGPTGPLRPAPAGPDRASGRVGHPGTDPDARDCGRDGSGARQEATANNPPAKQPAQNRAAAGSQATPAPPPPAPVAPAPPPPPKPTPVIVKTTQSGKVVP